jgi:orotidine-5'-phosphate decarboxylase
VNRETLLAEIKRKQSFLITGLDTDPDKLPAHLKQNPDAVFEFNRAIVEATHAYSVGYKINLAFYEAMGMKGWEALQQTLAVIPKNCFTIADAKRGDIGNTSERYAEAFFNTYSFDSITVAPYMGEDSVKPFLSFEGKWVIVLALTSNKGSNDFQMLKTDGRYLYEIVAEKVALWGTAANTMFVVGATHPERFESLRKILPEHFFLVPGVGAQGGDLQAICKAGMNNDCGLLVNASRSIIYASSGTDFAEKAKEEASRMQTEMAIILKEKGIIG